MKKIISLFLVLAFFSCAKEKSVKVTISNLSANDRKEVTEISLNELKGLENSSFIISDSTGKQLPYQITYDKKVIFPVDLKTNQSVTYTVKAGIPDSFQTIVCGRQYPERIDDIAWENDRIAFRTYGPALKASGEKAYGYDVWVKRVPELVVEERYKMELSKDVRAKIGELRKTNPEEANRLFNSISYHVDHGNGMDTYKVGPTLGAASTGIFVNDSIIYPDNYTGYKILDNGPLRFTVELTVDSVKIKDAKNIIETELISLDAYSQLNKISISYQNMTSPVQLVTGLVVHEPSFDFNMSTTDGYIAYAEAPDVDNGQTYVGAVFPEKIEDAKMVSFDDKEKKSRGAEGHVLAFTNYSPGNLYTYYGGAGWSKWGFATSADWFKYIQQFASNLKEPLKVTIE